VIDGLDFRSAYIHHGRVMAGDLCFSDLDLYFWFGELDRGRSSFHIEVLDAIAEQTTVVNSAQALRVALDKLLTQRCLQRHGIPIPEFLLVSRENVDAIREHVDAKPYIIKPRLGSFGVGITRVEGHDQLVDLIDYSEGKSHFLEAYIESSPERFIGVNVVGDRVCSAYGKESSRFRGWKVMDRQRRGGGMFPREPSAVHQQLAIAAARATGLDLAGVDIIQSRTGQDYVVDVNPFPGLYPSIQDDEVFVDRLVELLLSKLRSDASVARSAP